MSANRSLTGRSRSNPEQGQLSAGVREWGRARLMAILAAAVLIALTLIGGLGYAVYAAVSGVDDDGPSGRNGDIATGVSPQSTTARGAHRRDAIAAEPMLNVPTQAALPGTASSRGTGSIGAAGRAGSIVVPPTTGAPGPGLIATGFPRTPEGAIGQLAQIDIAVLQSMSPSTAREVYASWALPGGVDVDHWWLTTSVEAFLASSEMGQVKSPEAMVNAEPVAALVKGTDGPDWATVCVLLKVIAAYRSEGQAAFAHCERMQWVGGRWMLAPGAPPAPAPATWPDTPLAAAAGWRTWATDDADATAAQSGAVEPGAIKSGAGQGGDN